MGAFASWRAAHGVIRLLIAGGAVAHTGFRFGGALDATLTAEFLVCTLLGAGAGMASVWEPTLPPGTGTGARSTLNRLHLYLVWPLPILIVFHAVKFYYF